jgi:hypothetical protein
MYRAVLLLPPARVSTTIHVEYLSSYLICLRQEENSVDNVFYLHDFPHWLERLQDIPGLVLSAVVSPRRRGPRR